MLLIRFVERENFSQLMSRWKGPCKIGMILPPFRVTNGLHGTRYQLHSAQYLHFLYGWINPDQFDFLGLSGLAPSRFLPFFQRCLDCCWHPRTSVSLCYFHQLQEKSAASLYIQEKCHPCDVIDQASDGRLRISSGTHSELKYFCSTFSDK